MTRFEFEDGSILEHHDLLIKVFEADGVTPVPRESPVFGRPLVLVLGPVEIRARQFPGEPPHSNE